MRARWHKIKKRLEIKKEKKARMEEGKELRKEGWRIHNSDFFLNTILSSVLYTLSSMLS